MDQEKSYRAAIAELPDVKHQSFPRKVSGTMGKTGGILHHLPLLGHGNQVSR